MEVKAKFIKVVARGVKVKLHVFRYARAIQSFENASSHMGAMEVASPRLEKVSVRQRDISIDKQG